jgi:D-3-phosphoglycerate dehydrogenase
MKILIADKFPKTHLQKLKAQGHELSIEPDLGESTLAGAIADNEALVVRSTKVNAQTLQSGNALKLVIRAGAGTNTIDKPAATELNIRVCNVPGANALAVAELAIGLIIAIDRHIPASVHDLRNGQWNKKSYAVAQGLYGRKLGILGLGAIGFAVAERARAFGMEVSTVLKPERSADSLARMQKIGIQQQKDLDALLADCNIVSLHLPATDSTRQMVDTTFLQKMKPDAILLNTSRGELVDEQALIEAMDSKGIRAGLDVWADEPATGEGSFASALAKHRNVCGTHHTGASTEQAQTAVADGVLEIIDDYQQGHYRNCVNPVL